MKPIRLFLAGVLALASSLALAINANYTPVPGVIVDGGSTNNLLGINSSNQAQVSTETTKATYSATSTGLVPAASATDVFCIAGSSSKTIRVTRVGISGTAGTLVTVPVYLAKRATADTSGTAATSLALPVAVKHDSTDAASTATLVAYTANPTINDSSPGLPRAGTVLLPVTSAGTSMSNLVWNFAERNSKAVVLRGAAQQLCVNLSGISVSSGLLNIDVEWSEDGS